ncbi:DUF6777 domain-containing protein [Streptomyces sp. BI20]|uniref:DUF6777 domain-containing protein n=1 Tax=Streptomyces sp. BI20 TaxID=3403460 RepID=UPI003C77DBF9
MDVPNPNHRRAGRRRPGSRAALLTLVGLVAAACGAPEAGVRPDAESREVHLRPVGEVGPEPFTAPGSALGESAPLQAPVPNTTGRGIRTLGGATPGLFGATRGRASCDVEAQLRKLTADRDTAAAFAAAADLDTRDPAAFLRGLTPVVLRTDVRVTDHRLREGRHAVPYQAVLQAGSAVLVDAHGLPRVRCACGNPLQPPRAPRGTPIERGEPWTGYRPEQVVVIEPTVDPRRSLILADLGDNTWLERRVGDGGARDRTPAAPPAHSPTDPYPEHPGGDAPALPCPSPTADGLTRMAPPAAGPCGGTPPPGEPESERRTEPRTKPNVEPPRPEAPAPEPPAPEPFVPDAPPPDPFAPFDPGPLFPDPFGPGDPYGPDAFGPGEPAVPSDPYAPYLPEAPAGDGFALESA